jgi:hypothetical protein
MAETRNTYRILENNNFEDQEGGRRIALRWILGK